MEFDPFVELVLLFLRMTGRETCCSAILFHLASQAIIQPYRTKILMHKQNDLSAHLSPDFPSVCVVSLGYSIDCMVAISYDYYWVSFLYISNSSTKII